MTGPSSKETGEPEKSGPHRRWWVGLLVICLLAAGWYLYHVKGGKIASRAGQGAPASRPTPVLAAAAKKGDVGVYLTGLGSVAPVSTVSVKSRVDGQLMRVLFKEGQIVDSGELLAEIDPRPFEVQLTQAEGQMAKDQALLKNARLDLQRYQVLSEEDSISQQQRDTQEALVRQYEGAVKSDQGQIDSAKLQLVYSKITAPIGGRVGLRLVDPGNIVHASDPNGLVVITQLQPITVVFTIPEDSLPEVMKKLNSGERLPVDAFDREQKNKLASGRLLTADNQIDPSTGTVRLKAVFTNEGNELFPSQFVNARLLLDMKRDSVVVPSAAIQRGPQGTFVYLVKDDRTVTVRPVAVGVTHGGDTSITKGLAVGEVVVYDGAERLREGSKVEVKDRSGGAP